VVFGSGDGFGEREGGRNVVDLTRLTGDVGFEIASNTYDDFAESVSAAGDINGDGYDDLIIGADDGDIGGNNAGQAYVIFGQQFGSEPTTDTLFGTAAGERLNPIVSNAEVVKAGAGDDEIEATLAYFNSLAMVIDGGSGFDRLVTKFGDTFNDMEPLIEDIEALDMRGGDDNTLRVFDPLDVLNASSTSNQLVIFGDTSDTLEISTAFTAGTTGITGREGLTFNLYESGEASLLVQIGVDVDVLV
ncbi:MAG: integrin alpha, partial [Alphaproteobacteria bacterium]